MIANSDHISGWKSKRLSDENIKITTASNNSLPSGFNHINIKIQIKFDRSCLKQEKVTFTYKLVVNIYIVYEINMYLYSQGADFTTGNFLFGVVKLTKNFNPDKYFGYSLAFDVKGRFSLSDVSGFDENVIIFGADMSSSVHIDKKKDILIPGKGLMDGLDDKTLTTQKRYS